MPVEDSLQGGLACYQQPVDLCPAGHRHKAYVILEEQTVSGPLRLQGVVVQLSISPGGVPKLPVARTVIGLLGLEHDAHRDPGHGGPERAVCLYSLDRIEELRQEGHAIFPGSAGENVTISGLDWAQIKVGTKFTIGPEVVLEVTRYTTPCLNIAASFVDGKFARILHDQHPGFSRVYAKVVHDGPVRVGDAVVVEHATESH